MYIYSIALAIILVLISPRLHRRDPLAALGFAYLYVFDSLINALYTLLFGISWFLVLSSKHHSTGGPLGSAGKTIDSTSGFTSPTYNVSHVDVVTYPASSITDGQDAVAIETNVDGAGTSFLSSGVLQPESATSILIISILWAVRSYFILIVLAFARNVVRDSTTPTEAPFTGRNYGEGWKGRLGRGLVAVNKGYWLGTDGWVPFGNKFRRSEDARRNTRRASLPPV